MLRSLAAELTGLAGAQCVVTGGLGFIGSNLVHALADAGAHVRVIDALVPHHGGDRRNLADLADVPVLVSDLGGPDVAEVLDGADVVFNLAGQVSHRSSMTDPLGDLDLNVRSHLAFLETLRRTAPMAHVVLTSTRQVYGRPVYLPVDELHPTAPVDVNGVDKLACEQFHLLYHHVYGQPVSVLRLTNVYGPRQNLTKPDLGALPVFISQALNGDTIRLYGTGDQRRDCLHVTDVVAALAMATNDRCVGEIINLGHEHSWTLREIVGAIVEASGSTSSIEFVPWPAELERIDIGDFQGDWTKAGEVLGWKPLVGLAEGFADTVQYVAEHPWYRSSS